jgi:hypothetical protein
MGRIIKLRRCNPTQKLVTRNQNPLIGLLVFSLWFLAGGALAVTAPLPKLPVIQQVGVIPVQWEGESLTAGKAAIDASFSQVVRDSHRFRVLNDDLIAQTWATVDGRQELKDQFELQGFVSLTVTPRSDTVQLTCRLMDSNLKTNLLETDVVTVDWLANASESSVRDRLERLVFRLFNRIPVDVSVTSVQGSYITLSGGSEQGIEAGDKVDLVRAEIKALHPANGTWLEFQKQNLGTNHRGQDLHLGRQDHGSNLRQRRPGFGRGAHRRHRLAGQVRAPRTKRRLPGFGQSGNDRRAAAL